ncbi:hypothetical protein Clacol_008078 [Clathrus columnatus]|uniref:Uncharacterized protein n=1 Tax=Clathrus columnatus TaxID=1419009 RepID=A0AAV5AN19_9AGAM|nr:hypothetical protein Clacol_008078 [Clathrus columnatus]
MTIMASEPIPPASEDTDTDTFLKSFGKALAIFFLPHLFAFILQSSNLLRTYIALLVAPNPDPHEPEKTPDKTPDSVKPWTFKQKWHIISAIVVLSTLSIVQFEGTVYQNLSILSLAEAVVKFCNYVLPIVLFLLVVAMTAQISRPGKSSVHRTPNGGFVIVGQGGLGLQATKQQRILTSLLTFITSIFAFLMVGGLFESNNSLPTAVVMMAYISGILMILARMSLRPLIIMYSVSITVIVIFVLLSLVFDGDMSELELAWEILSSVMQKAWVTSLSYPPRRILSLQAQRSHVPFGPDISYEVALHPTDPKITKGIMIPQSLPCKFPKPYYTLALITWSLTRIAILALCLVTGFPTKNIYGASGLAVLVEFPIMIIALFILATIRGESKALWNYKEIWTVDMKMKPSSSDSTLEEGVSLLANEDE